MVTDVFAGLNGAGQLDDGDFFRLITERADHNLDSILGKQALCALYQDAAKTAMLLGHTQNAGVLWNHYRELVTESMPATISP